mgnify:CR=1 FL=1
MEKCMEMVMLCPKAIIHPTQKPLRKGRYVWGEKIGNRQQPHRLRRFPMDSPTA